LLSSYGTITFIFFNIKWLVKNIIVSVIKLKRKEKDKEFERCMIAPLNLCWFLSSPQKGNRPFGETALAMALWSYGEGLIGGKCGLVSHKFWVAQELASLFTLFGWKLGMHISFFLEEPLLFPFCW